MTAHTILPMSEGKSTAAFQMYIGQPQNWNRYGYVGNHPPGLIDPDGKQTQAAIGGRVGDNIFGHASIIISGTAYSYGTNNTHGAKYHKDWGGDAKAFLADLLKSSITPAEEQGL